MRLQTSLLVLKSIFLPCMLCLELGQDGCGCNCSQLFLWDWVKGESVCSVISKHSSWLWLCKLMLVV